MTRWLVAHRRAVLAIAIVLTGVSGFGLVRLTTDYDPRSFHPQGTELVQPTRRAEAIFGTDDRVALVGLVDPALATPEGFGRIAWLTARLGEIAGIESVVSLTNVRGVRGTGDTLEVAPLIGSKLPGTQTEALAALAALRADPFVPGALLSHDGQACLIQATVKESTSAPKARALIHDQIAALLEAPQLSGVEAHLGGFPMVRVEYSRAMGAELGRLLAAVFGILLLLLWALLRSLSGALVTVAVVAVANVWTHAVMGAMGQPVTILSMLTPLIVMIVGVADSMHIILTYSDSEGTPTERVLATLDMNLLPTFVTAASTAVGFLSLLTAVGVPMIGIYGVYTALGVVLAWLVTICLVPPLLSLGLVRIGRRTRGGPWDSRLQRLVSHITAKPLGTLLFSAVFTVTCTVLAFQVSTDARILDGLDPAHPIMRTNDLLESRFGGSLPLQVLYEGVDPADPAVLAHMRDTAAWLRAHELVGVVVSPDSLVARFHAALNGEEAASLPTDADEISEIYLAASFSDPNPFDRLVSESQKAARIQVLLHERGSHATIAIQDALLEDIATRPLPGVAISLAGTAYVAPRAWRILQANMGGGLGWSVLLITLIFALMCRSMSLSLVSLIPNLIPLAALGAVMTLCGIASKGNNAVVFSIAYGIAVDDTIHFLAQIRHTAKLGLPWRETIVEAHRTIRGAILMTGAILAAGFAVFITSSFEFTQTLGIQMVASVTVAAAGDILLLPALLILLRNPYRQGAGSRGLTLPRSGL